MASYCVSEIAHTSLTPPREASPRLEPGRHTRTPCILPWLIWKQKALGNALLWQSSFWAPVLLWLWRCLDDFITDFSIPIIWTRQSHMIGRLGDWFEVYANFLIEKWNIFIWLPLMILISGIYLHGILVIYARKSSLHLSWDPQSKYILV